MASPPSEPRAAGVLIALGALAGAGIGAVWGESSAGLLIGIALGVAIAVALWLKDRARD